VTKTQRAEQELKGRTIRQAIAVALEGLNGDLYEWVVLAQQRNAMRKHVILWVADYAQNRGVILGTKDITDELDKVITELRRGAALAQAATEGDVSDA
jgi:hypothetical protein